MISLLDFFPCTVWNSNLFVYFPLYLFSLARFVTHTDPYSFQGINLVISFEPGLFAVIWIKGLPLNLLIDRAHFLTILLYATWVLNDVCISINNHHVAWRMSSDVILGGWIWKGWLKRNLYLTLQLNQGSTYNIVLDPSACNTSFYLRLCTGQYLNCTLFLTLHYMIVLLPSPFSSISSEKAGTKHLALMQKIVWKLFATASRPNVIWFDMQDESRTTIDIQSACEPHTLSFTLSLSEDLYFCPIIHVCSLHVNFCALLLCT